jgi:hypothetical protein
MLKNNVSTSESIDNKTHKYNKKNFKLVNLISTLNKKLSDNKNLNDKNELSKEKNNLNNQKYYLEKQSNQQFSIKNLK